MDVGATKLSVTDGAQWLSLQTELHTRPVSFLVSGEALETNSRAAPLSTFRLSRARFELLVSKYRAGGEIRYFAATGLRKSICTDAKRCPGRAQHDLSPSITARVPALDENVYFE